MKVRTKLFKTVKISCHGPRTLKKDNPGPLSDQTILENIGEFQEIYVTESAHYR